MNAIVEISKSDLRKQLETDKAAYFNAGGTIKILPGYKGSVRRKAGKVTKEKFRLARQKTLLRMRAPKNNWSVGNYSDHKKCFHPPKNIVELAANNAGISNLFLVESAIKNCVPLTAIARAFDAFFQRTSPEPWLNHCAMMHEAAMLDFDEKWNRQPYCLWPKGEGEWKFDEDEEVQHEV